jgi:hypothetical protein
MHYLFSWQTNVKPKDGKSLLNIAHEYEGDSRVETLKKNGNKRITVSQKEMFYRNGN